MIEVIDAWVARQALAAGRLACLSCSRMLRPWGRTGERTVVEAAAVRFVRLDRARCRSCRATHVVLPVTLIPRRSYPLARVATALAAACQGVGSRSIAARIDVPVGTVRCWLRRARDNADALYRFGVQTVVVLNPDLLPTTPRPTQLGDALTALGAAAAATIQRFTLDHQRTPWPVINVLTRGRLLAPTFSP